MRRVALVVNPASGHGRARRLTPLIERRLADAGIAFTTRLSTSYEDALALCEGAVVSGADALLVVGGDGMAHLGLNACALTDVPLGVVPAGTGNDFARSVGSGLKWDAAVDAVIAGRTRTIDLAEIRGNLTYGDLAYVGCVVSTGFDERVNFRANASPIDLGAPSYLWAVLAELRDFRPLRYRLVLDGEERELDSMLVAVANAGYFGGGIAICPDYDLADGLLDVAIVHPVPRMVLLTMFPRLASGKPFEHPAIERLRVREIIVDGPGLRGMADGEHLGTPPLACRAVPGALTIHVQ